MARIDDAELNRPIDDRQSLSAPPATWAIADPEAVHWREWDGEAVVFSGATGSTHLLNPPVADVFATLLAAPAGLMLEELARRLLGAPSSDTPRVPADDPAALENILLDFERLGLARRRVS